MKYEEYKEKKSVCKSSYTHFSISTLAVHSYALTLNLKSVTNKQNMRLAASFEKATFYSNNRFKYIGVIMYWLWTMLQGDSFYFCPYRFVEFCSGLLDVNCHFHILVSMEKTWFSPCRWKQYCRSSLCLGHPMMMKSSIWFFHHQGWYFLRHGLCKVCAMFVFFSWGMGVLYTLSVRETQEDSPIPCKHFPTRRHHIIPR